MKKILLGAVALFTLAFIFTGCSNDSDGDGSTDNRAGVDFTNYIDSSDYVVKIKNNTALDLVAFKGNPSSSNLIGGIPASNTNFGLKKNSTLFSTTQDFILTIVKLSDYKKYKEDNNLAALKNTPFATFYAVYNTNSTNENYYEISSALNGQYKIIINNATNYNVELRNMGPEGDTLGFSMAQTYEKSFGLTSGEYMIFPVFRKYDKTSSEIISTYPTYKTGQLAGQAKSWEFSLDNETTEQQFNTANWISDINFSPSAAYIKIINNADQGLQFFEGATSTPTITSAGGKRINTSKSLTFAITMDKTTSNAYESERIAAGYRVGTNRIDNIYLNGDATTTQTYKAGYLYTYTVTGDASNGYVVTPLTEDITKEDGTVTKQIKAVEIDWSSI